MRKSQLEAIVTEAVVALRSGRHVEDDRIEFKRDWPGVGKARQLAAAARQFAPEKQSLTEKLLSRRG